LFAATFGPVTFPVINNATKKAAADTLAAIKMKNVRFERLLRISGS
jgi:hypothetical protein